MRWHKAVWKHAWRNAQTTMRLVGGHARLHLVVAASAAVITGRKLADNLAKADNRLPVGNLRVWATHRAPGEAECGGLGAKWLIAERETRPWELISDLEQLKNQNSRPAPVREIERSRGQLRRHRLGAASRRPWPGLRRCGRPRSRSAVYV